MKEFYSKDECIRIERADNGKYWITFGVGYSPSYCGGFKTEEAATETMKKLRPDVQLYREA